MIYKQAAKNSKKHQWIELPNLTHSLRDFKTEKSKMAEIITEYVKEIY
ncbi:MAG: hypothetical protein PHZ25_02290 [Candidatus Pacebacteria bacterium]|nr:hypothetical protein [Candidatus Paceibacterota bacterium]